MRYGFLTPHQYQSVSPFIDTWILSTHSPWALDVSSPHAASQWIVRRLAGLIKERFMGRTAELDLGAALVPRGLDTEFLSECLQTIEDRPQNQEAREDDIQFAVVLTDRILVRDSLSWTDRHGVRWLAVDWWHWFSLRVPPHRLSDAWLYLCLTDSSYLSSFEFKRIGIDPATAANMASQGNELMQQFVTALAAQIVAAWQEATPAEKLEISGSELSNIHDEF